MGFPPSGIGINPPFATKNLRSMAQKKRTWCCVWYLAAHSQRRVLLRIKVLREKPRDRHLIAARVPLLAWRFGWPPQLPKLFSSGWPSAFRSNAEVTTALMVEVIGLFLEGSVRAVFKWAGRVLLQLLV